MKLLSTILLMLLAGITSHAIAEDKTIITSKDFSIRCKSLTTENAIEKRINIIVHAEYSSKDQEIMININAMTNDNSKKPFVLKYPLDFEVFTQRFDSILNARVSESEEESLFIFYGSHLDVFYWIVTINEKGNTPLAGTLTTNQYVMVSSANEQNESYTERAKRIKNEIDSLEIRNTKFELIQDKVDTEVTTLKNLITEYEKPDLKEEVKTLKLTEISSKSKSLFPDLQNESNEKLITSSKSKLKIYETDPTISPKLDILNNAIKTQNDKIANLRIRKVSHVQYQFEKGYLERIQVYIESPETENKEVYENAYPIGFSSISNYKNFTGIRLFRRSSRFETDINDQYIYLSDIIKLYENELNLATRDYSPGDTTITVFPTANPITRLTKQRSIYIIDGKTFTDVTGLSEDSPNGLVQVELSRRFNLWTYRFQVRGSNNYGFVNYVNARVNFSKIENKLKGLPLRNELVVENDAIVSPSYATNLDYLRYENLGISLDINTFLFDAPDFKYTIFLDAGIHYGHTPIIDSNFQIDQGVATTTETVDKLDAHNFTVFPRAKIQLFAERRYGLSFSYQANYTWLFTNNRFKQVMSYSGKGQDLNSLSTNQRAHWSHMIETAFYVDVNPTSSTGKIFATARFFFQQGDVNTFYPQILLGYAFNIFK